MFKYYYFETEEEFNTWHTQIKNILGYPLSDGITTEYTSLQPHPHGGYCAAIQEEHASGLEETSSPAGLIGKPN